MIRIMIGVLCIVIMPCVAERSFAFDYQVINFGSTFEPYKISSQGEVIGILNGCFAAVWRNGTITSLGGFPTYPERGWTYARGVNRGGEVVGHGFCNETDQWGNHYQHAFYWSDGTGMIDFGAPGGVSSENYDINDSGQVIGVVRGPTGEIVSSYIWQDGNRMDLGPLIPYAINNNGQVLGTWDGEAAIWESGSLSKIGQFQPYDINDLGQVIGTVLAHSNQSGCSGDHACLWSSGTITDLGTIGSRNTSSPNGFNNNGEVVGYSEGVPFLWRNGVMIDINSLLPAASILSISTASDINDTGQIIVNAYIGSEYHSCLLNPVPEPSPFLALLGGIAGIGGLILRRWNKIIYQ